ncbi:phosphotransferase [Dethiobacter alkaliphilus]|uniref:Tetratricopeptide TPR_2 repeat protein n=1 Tax=Dethiobacter alkaliphilus AHT 1 TaxID=555088 RepID=C0GGT1_DETAL|nr:phosphotransferase [Dethiobacter alkaliphilus]EEG77522.1 Tetratricopeptide TPR_2 repeat protein [Dethiobacter alkaliphilus AHT 1]
MDEYNREIQDFIKEKKWRHAIGALEKYININHADDVAYRDLGQCLRFEGEYKEAQSVLERGLEQFPQNQSLLAELYNLYSVQKKWEKAKLIAEELIKIDKDNGIHYFKLGRSYNFLKKSQEATKAFIQALELEQGTTLEELTELVKKSLSIDEKTLESEYVFSGGKNNYGCLVHVETDRPNPQEYITKIADIKLKRERLFYEEIVGQFPQLQKVTPELISIIDRNNMSFLTMEKITGNVPLEKDLQSIIKSIQNTLATIKPKDYFHHFSIPTYRLVLRGKSQNILHFFTSIHNQATNVRLISLLEKRLKNEDYPNEALDVIKRLKFVFLEMQLYEKVNPDKHYRFLHGDLGPHNIIMKEDTKEPVLIDWNSYTVGPVWFDIANLIVKLKLNFVDIKKLFLENPEKGMKLENIEKIFFIYALIVIKLQSLNKKKTDNALIDFYLPAITYLEKLALSYANQEQRKVLLQQRQVVKRRFIIKAKSILANVNRVFLN